MQARFIETHQVFAKKIRPDTFLTEKYVGLHQSVCNERMLEIEVDGKRNSVILAAMRQLLSYFAI